LNASKIKAWIPQHTAGNNRADRIAGIRPSRGKIGKIKIGTDPPLRIIGGSQRAWRGASTFEAIGKKCPGGRVRREDWSRGAREQGQKQHFHTIPWVFQIFSVAAETQKGFFSLYLGIAGGLLQRKRRGSAAGPWGTCRAAESEVGSRHERDLHS
jgi:hypothetical protein